MAADIRRAMSLIAGRDVTPDTIARVQAIAHSLEIPLNDSMMPILITLDTYYGAFKDLPKQHQQAAEQAAESAKELVSAKIDLLTTEAIKAVSGEVATTVSKLADKVATDTATRDKSIWIAGAAASVAIAFAVFGMVIHKTARIEGYNSGYAVGYRESKDEKAAANWANTAQGKLAYKFAQMGELDSLMNCNKPGWEITKRKDGSFACIPNASKDGSKWGWRID